MALEVTEFKLPTDQEQASAGSGRAASLMLDRLAALASELALGFMTLDLRYIVGKVPTKRRTAPETERLLLAIEAGMRTMSAAGLERLDIGTPVPWVEPVSLQADRGSDNPRLVVWHGSSGGGRLVAPVMDSFIADRAASKGPQTADYERGMLGIYPGWIADADNLVEAIQNLSDVPWWRVYYIDRTGVAILVYTADEQPPSEGVETPNV